MYIYTQSGISRIYIYIQPCCKPVFIQTVLNMPDECMPDEWEKHPRNKLVA